MPFPFLLDTEHTSLAARSVGSVKSRQCRFTVDTPDGSDWTFCSATAVRGSYCDAHALRAYSGTARIPTPILAVVGTRQGRAA